MVSSTSSLCWQSFYFWVRWCLQMIGFLILTSLEDRDSALHSWWYIGNCKAWASDIFFQHLWVSSTPEALGRLVLSRDDSCRNSVKGIYKKLFNGVESVTSGNVLSLHCRLDDAPEAYLIHSTALWGNIYRWGNGRLRKITPELVLGHTRSRARTSPWIRRGPKPALLGNSLFTDLRTAQRLMYMHEAVQSTAVELGRKNLTACTGTQEERMEKPLNYILGPHCDFIGRRTGTSKRANEIQSHPVAREGVATWEMNDAKPRSKAIQEPGKAVKHPSVGTESWHMHPMRVQKNEELSPEDETTQQGAEAQYLEHRLLCLNQIHCTEVTLDQACILLQAGLELCSPGWPQTFSPLSLASHRLRFTGVSTKNRFNICIRNCRVGHGGSSWGRALQSSSNWELLLTVSSLVDYSSVESRIGLQKPWDLDFGSSFNLAT